MPESMSMERRKLLKAFGAELVLTSAELGMNGAIAKADELQATISNSHVLQQFKNPANPAVHRRTTAIEILTDTDRSLDVFVAAIGTGGTITGTGDTLKKELPNIQIIGVEPSASAILSGGKAGPHKIQGIGAGFIPDTLNTEIYTEMVKVTNEDAMRTARNLAKNEGLLVGISAGANVFAATEIASRAENRGKTIVTILCDTGERYLSTELFSND